MTTCRSPVLRLVNLLTVIVPLLTTTSSLTLTSHADFGEDGRVVHQEGDAVGGDRSWVPARSPARRLLQTTYPTGVYPVIATQAEKDYFVNRHNEYRRGSGSSNMETLFWNEFLAEMAQEWADACDFNHGQPARTSQPYANLGQNLYYTSATTIDLPGVMAAWYDEVAFYDYSTVTCQTGKVCGHYTQVVWAKSRDVGCAYSQVCTATTGTSGGTGGLIAVCNYGPRGNYAGAAPFLTGSPCTACTINNAWCRQNLCIREICNYAQCGTGATCTDNGDQTYTCNCADGSTSSTTCSAVDPACTSAGYTADWGTWAPATCPRPCGGCGIQTRYRCETGLTTPTPQERFCNVCPCIWFVKPNPMYEVIYIADQSRPGHYVPRGINYKCCFKFNRFTLAWRQFIHRDNRRSCWRYNIAGFTGTDYTTATCGTVLATDVEVTV